MPTYILPSSGHAYTEPYVRPASYDSGYPLAYPSMAMPMPAPVQPMYVQEPQMIGGYSPSYYGNAPYYSSHSGRYYHGSGHRHHRHHGSHRSHGYYNSSPSVYYKHRTIGDQIMGAFGVPQSHMYRLG